MAGTSQNEMDSMATEEARFASFQNWPFDENSKCSSAKMAEAGFFHTPTEEEPDLVQCFFCLKQLLSWESNDEPWLEHASHSKRCIFARLRKPQRNLTIKEFCQIEAERKCIKIRTSSAKKIQEFKEKCGEIEKLFADGFEEVGGKFH